MFFRRLLGSVLLAALSGAALGQGLEEALDWGNPFLGPRFSQWLVGAIGHLATEQERTEFLILENDEEAARFVERFWSDPKRLGVPDVFERRAEIADKRFTEGAYPGRKSDRGTIFILFGEPDDISFEQHRNVLDPVVEMWEYPKRSAPGLGGKKPDRHYRFVRDGDLTHMFKKGDARDPEVLRRRRPRPFDPPPYRPPRSLAIAFSCESSSAPSGAGLDVPSHVRLRVQQVEIKLRPAGRGSGGPAVSPENATPSA